MLDLPDLHTSAAAFTPPVGRYELPGRRGAITADDSFPLFDMRKFRKRPPAQEDLGSVEELASNNPLDQLCREQAKKQAAQARVRSEIVTRIRELCLDAVVDGDAFSEESLTDLLSFLRAVKPTVRPSLFLLDNGNLRALWRNDNGEQVGLQFMGHDLVQYVIFARRSNGQMMRHFGQDVQSEIQKKISQNGGDHLIV